MSNLDQTFNMHCKATYISSIQKYFMITYVNGQRNVYMLLSGDGLNWEVAESIIDHNTESRVSYPFIGDFYTDDCHEVDDEFHIYWARNYRDLWGARVTVSPSNSGKKSPEPVILFSDSFGSSSRGEYRENVVHLPPPEGLGFTWKVLEGGYLPVKWILADELPDDDPKKVFG